MADKPEKKTGGKVGFVGLFLALVVAVAAVFLMPTTLIFVVGMVPTLVAGLTDNTKEKTAALTIGSMNFAGVLPALLNLWQTGHIVDNALGIISQPYMLLSMYGSAGIGAMIYVNTPPMVAGFLKKKDLRRFERIEKRHAALLDKWGLTVTGMSAEAAKNAENQKEQEK